MDIFDLAKARILAGKGGGGDHSMDDGLIEGTITEYRNDRVTKIGERVFKEQWQLTSVDFPNVVEVGYEAFYSCECIESMNFPNLKRVGEYAFAGISYVTSVRFPNVETIEREGFAYMYGLEIADFPKLKYLGGLAFADCPLRALILRGEFVENIGTCCLQGSGILDYEGNYTGTGHIYVPRDLVNAYIESTTPNFSQVFRALEDYTVDGTITGELDMSKI